jgi:hypothetical protein
LYDQGSDKLLVVSERIPVVGDGMVAPLPTVSAVRDDGETIAEEEEEDESVKAERGASQIDFSTDLSAFLRATTCARDLRFDSVVCLGLLTKRCNCT